MFYCLYFHVLSCVWFKFSFCSKRMKAIHAIKITVVFRRYCKIIPSFSIWNYKKNNLFSRIWILFWNIGKIYFSFLACKALTAVVRLFFSNFIMGYLFFPSFIYLLKVWFLLFFEDLFLFLHDLTQLLHRIESIFYFFYWLDLLLFFFVFFYPIKRIYLQFHHNSDLLYDIYNTINEHN